MEKRHEIEMLAYEIFEMRGQIPGHEMEHWLEAERIIHSRNASAGKSIVPAAQKGAAPKSAAKKGAPKSDGKALKTMSATTKVSALPKTSSSGKSKKTAAGKTATP